MAKNLVIVESPTKAKTIERYLGEDFKVVATNGHFRDLPPQTMGIRVEDDFKPVYIETDPRKIVELKKLAKTVDFVYIATDPDREGEAIAWHVAHVLKIDPTSNCRVTFNEITKKTILESIKVPRAIDMNLFYAQQARRLMDRFIGYEIGPITQRIRENLSAGRVQSVVAKIIMDRDLEIEKFQSEDYWLISAIVSPDTKKDSFKVRYLGTKEGDKVNKPKNGRILSEDEANSIVNDVKGNSFEVTSVKKGSGKRSPAPPFTTSTMQQEAAKRLGFSTKTTTKVAQDLYEGIDIKGLGPTGLVTYIRTDSVRVSEEAIAASHEYIVKRYGKEFVCPYKREFKNRNSSQDAHEAIRPAHFDLNPESIKDSLKPEQYKLYKLIWDRFLASQMADAKTHNVTIEATCGKHVFNAKGETIVFPGFLDVYGDVANKENENKENDEEKSEKILLPELNEGQSLNNLETICDKKKTLPPPHFTEATLVKYMEENNIGRPSTYSKMIENVLGRNYVEKDGKALVITELGKFVTVILEEHFADIIAVPFSAGMEAELDKIESGTKWWVDTMKEFYYPFHEKVLVAASKVKDVKYEAEKIDEICPLCKKGDLVIRSSRNGKFIGCSCYPKCDYTRNIQVVVKGHHCPKCGSDLFSGKFNKSTYYQCVNNKSDDKAKASESTCDFRSWILPIDGRKCEKCGSYMGLKRGRGRSFFPVCSNDKCEVNVARKEAYKNKNSKKKDDEN